MEGLNQRGLPLKGSKVLVLGIAYKKNVDDMRESPAVEVMEVIQAKGAVVAYSDPHVAEFPRMREHYFELTSLPQQCPTMANVHLDATEYQDHVVFLHNIQEGPANRSFGLQVAKLAGIPGAVLQAAQEKLEELERGEQQPTRLRASKAAPSPQPDMFSAPAPHPVVKALDTLDVDNLTPRLALEKLYELKASLD